MASSYIKVYTKDSNTNEAVLLRTYGGNRSDVKWECNAYRDLNYIKEKHPHLNDTEIDNLYIVCYNVLNSSQINPFKRGIVLWTKKI